MADVADVKLMVTLPTRSALGGIETKQLKTRIIESCAEALESAGIHVDDSSDRTLLVDISSSDFTACGQEELIAVAIGAEFLETLADPVFAEEVGASTWQAREVIIVNSASFGNEVFDSATALAIEFADMCSFSRNVAYREESKCDQSAPEGSRQPK